MRQQAWQFWIDVGGTFTDCIGVAPNGTLHEFKTLSSGATRGELTPVDAYHFRDSQRCHDPPNFWRDAECRLLSASGDVMAISRVARFDATTGTIRLETPADLSAATRYEMNGGVPAPVLAIRWLLRLAPDEMCPPVHIRFGTTRGTNALLTRTGARTALITTRGFADVAFIGNQDRPNLFDLNIRKPEPLFAAVFEVDERITATGTVLTSLNGEAEMRQLQAAGLNPDKFDSVAICLMNSYASDVHESLLERVVRDLGFSEVSRSSEVSRQIRIVPRNDTTVLDAYLNPVLRTYLDDIAHHLPGSDIQVMTSVGGLVERKRFRGRDCILSGPAGGIVGFANVAEADGHRRAIGFDMGGTSTDVARYDGQFTYQNESTKAGVRILTPVLAIETVAAGGGSICGFDGTRLFVGPQSAGADPGPACYGAGGPLTVTDLNVFLGRIQPQHFPFPLNRNAIHQRLSELRDAMITANVISTHKRLEDLAEGLLEIANDNMAQAIRRVSVTEGYHPQDYVLVSFGGAGGQHAVSIARRLGIRQTLIHPMAGILSAYGMGQADIRAVRQQSVLRMLHLFPLKELQRLRTTLAQETEKELRHQLTASMQIQPPRMSLELRYAGTDSALMIPESESGDFRELFEEEHQRQFGYRRRNQDIEVAAIRVETIATAAAPVSASESANSHTQDSPARQPETAPVWFRGKSCRANVYQRESLTAGQIISGPAIICERTSTILIEQDCIATIESSGTVRIDIPKRSGASVSTTDTVDPVSLEVFNNQFVSIAEQMGETLRRTSTSTNVRERLDYSCALFDECGNLVVNAPHVPVHLGAMSETVRSIMADHSDIRPGDVFVTNDPFRGGSHLPDVTVVTPVFVTPESDSAPHFFVANRAHHAEIGGIAPGSMPPFSTNLGEEGVLIRSCRLVEAGESREDKIRELLSSGPWPSRAVEDNLADLAAQVAANECGVRLLRELSQQSSAHTVQKYMKQIQIVAAQKMRRCLTTLDNGRHEYTDQLDDGTQIHVAVTITDDTANVDFAGTTNVHPQNLNANRAITTATVLYAFRCLLNEDVPLNAGVLDPVTIHIPEGLLNPQPGITPESSPAIVGGNVETSQRIVDVLLGALRLAAGSQGTMNNLTFGDDSFGYYETICGGAGATTTAAGADAVHTHMTNTRLTDPEVLEQRYPVRLSRFQIRRGSGGAGEYRGGDGIIRELEFLAPLQVSMLSQRRTHQPRGMHGGHPGDVGRNTLIQKGVSRNLGGCFSRTVSPGDRLVIETPGGGGAGEPRMDANKRE